MSKDLYIDRIVYDYIVPEIKYQLTNSAFTKREQRKAIRKIKKWLNKFRRIND